MTGIVKFFGWLFSSKTDGWFWPLVMAGAILWDVADWVGWFCLGAAALVAGLDAYLWYLKRQLAKAKGQTL